MKKKLMMAALALFTMMSAFACQPKQSKMEMKTQVNDGKNVLVAYFSYSGTTKGYAEKIAKLTGGDLFEI